MKKPPAVWLAAALAVAAVPALADIYVWRDSAGVSHYTNDVENVPPAYRNTVMTVARDWARAAPPPEPPAAPAPPAPPPAAAPVDVRELYDAGYAAGVRAAESSPPPANPPTLGSVVQNNVQVMSRPDLTGDRLVPFLGPVVVDRRHPRDHDRREDRRDGVLPPASPAPFLQGPAGPPPLNAAR